MDKLTAATLRSHVATVVKNAEERGDIDAGRFTLGVAKRQVAKALGLEPEVLNDKKWKQKVKDLVYDAIENVDTSKNGGSPVKPPRRTEEDTKAEQVAFIHEFLGDREEQTQPRRRDNHSGGEEGGGGDAKKRRRGKQHTKEGDDDGRQSSGKKQRMGGKLVKAERKPNVVWSDEDNDKPHLSSMVASAANGDNDDVESLDELPPPRRKRAKLAPAESGNESSDNDGGRNRNGEDKSKGKGKQNADGAAVNGKPKSSVKASTSAPAVQSSAPIVEDERVKELKSIVVACGVRKQWKKEFQGMDSPREQIAHLKDLLSALGMKGRPTKAKAKAIKEKREMAAELGDVLEFEAKRGLGITSRRTGIASRTTLDEGGTSKKRRATVTRKIDDSPSEGSSSDSDRPSRLDQTMHVAILDTDDEIDESEDAGKGRNTKGNKARTNMQVAKGGKQRLKVIVDDSSSEESF